MLPGVLLRGLVPACLLAACGGEPPQATVTGEGGSHAATTGATTSTGAGAGNGFVARTFHLSIIAETEPGHAPALIRLANETIEDRLAITLPDGEAFAFYDVPSQTTTGYVPAALSNPVLDVILSLCTTEACIKLNFNTIGGVQVLEPIAAYTLAVTKPDGFAAEIRDDPAPEPFIGVRPHVIDGSAGINVGTHLDLVLSGQQLVIEKNFMPVPGRYELLAPTEDPRLEQLTYIDGEGTAHTLDAPLDLPVAPGYTVVLGPSPMDGATADVLLVRQD